MPNVETLPSTARPMPSPSNVRLRRPDRSLVIWAASALDALIAKGRQARVIWAVVPRLDLSLFYTPIKARAGVCGRDATDPARLIALSVFAATKGVGSARELDRLSKVSDAYKWLCGNVSLNHHTLVNFRVGQRAALDALPEPKRHRGMNRFLVRGRPRALCDRPRPTTC